MHGSQGLSAPKQRELLDLLLSRTTGAGLSILRLGIDSGIRPTDPGGPDATPEYTWDGYDKRLWAMAHCSRFIRPGATRIGATTPDGALKLSAFRNTDGTVTVLALNTATEAHRVGLGLRNTGITGGNATPYLTNGSNGTSRQASIPVATGSFTATVPARSLVTHTIRR